MTQAFICDAVRTPIGRYGGALANVRTDDLAAIPLAALIARNPGLDVERIDEIFLGCANQSGEDNRNVARMAALLAGLPPGVPGTTINRLCASGLDAVALAARSVRSGDMDLAIAGGVESMSRAPFVMGKASAPFGREHKLEDTTLGWRFVNPLMKARYGIESMAETGENVAAQFGISREDQDAYAFQSQQRTERAAAQGWFSAEIVPIETMSGRKAMTVERDEHPRPETTPDKLAALRAPFRTGGTVTAGNASGINDGAAAMIVTSEAAARVHGLTPRARFLGMASAGVEPRIMGIGPVAATRRLLARTGLRLDDFDHIEINEAFASQVVASLRSLDIDPADERVNPNGGSIALGHPLGMSGARLALAAAHAFDAGKANRALLTLCVGVGQGVAVALERV